MHDLQQNRITSSAIGTVRAVLGPMADILTLYVGCPEEKRARFLSEPKWSDRR